MAFVKVADNMPPMPGTEDLSLGKVARLCGVSRSTVYRWVVGGQLQAYPLPSGHFRVKPIDVSRFCQANGVPDPLQGVDSRTIESHEDIEVVTSPAAPLLVLKKPSVSAMSSVHRRVLSRWCWSLMTNRQFAW